MKVVLLAPTPPPSGGISSWTVRMLNTCLKNGWKVEVVDEKLIEDRETFGDKNKRKLLTELKRSLSIWKRLTMALKDEDVKIVHSCIPAGTAGMAREYVCAIITKLSKRKFIIHYRCTLPNMVQSKTGTFVFKRLTKISDLVMVLNADSKEFVEKYGMTKVTVIPNFIEGSAIIGCETKKINEVVHRIVYVGGVIETKGCSDIIKVAEKFPGIQFRLVGNPENKIINMDKPGNVSILGEKNKAEVKKELEEADLFMFLSYYSGEGFSNALAEAMASGLPCIVTDWAANKDMIEGKGGIVVPIKDINSMTAAVEKLIGDRDLRERQSRWNINKVKSCYADTIVTDMYVNEYEKILKGRDGHEN